MAEDGTSPIDEIEPIKPATPIEVAQTETMSLDQLSGLAMRDSIASGNLSFAVEGAMGSITRAPGAPAGSIKDEITAGLSGEVGREKVDVMGSDAVHDGAAEGTMEAEQDKMVARFTDLYVDMTIYQVGWSIARRVQQDTSQLLRGQ